jgi:IS1 family transposase
VNVLSREQQLACLHLLVEGNSLRSVTRLTRVHRTTVMRLMVEVGAFMRSFLDRTMRNLRLKHCETDEIWTFVLKKQAKLNSLERDNPALGDQYLFLPLDEETKLVPCFLIGKRTKENAVAIMADLADRIIVPDPFELHTETPPLISTDGFAAYPDAVEQAFGPSVRYGVIVKDFTESEQPGRYGPPEMTFAVRTVIQGHFSRYEICTSHVERHNLTIRTFMRRFTRLALGFSKKLENLVACTALYVAHYNFCRSHISLSDSTPAMRAGIAGHPWTLAELLERAEQMAQAA